MAEPGNEAVNRRIAARAQAPGGAPAAPAGPAGPGAKAPEGATQNPLETAIKLMDAVVFRLGQANPEAADKLTAAIDNLKTVASEIQQGAGAGTPPPGGAAPKLPAPAPAPGGERLPQ